MGNALKRRGLLTIWFDSNMKWTAKPTGKCWRQPIYSNAAVQTCLTMKILFGMAPRQTTGVVESLFASSHQVGEFQVRLAVLNGYIALRIPVTKVVGRACPVTRDLRPSTDSYDRFGLEPNMYRSDIPGCIDPRCCQNTSIR